MQKNKKKWIRTRHTVVRNLLYWPFYAICVFKYGLKVEKFKGDTNRPYLMLFNHQTAFDQFFISLAFKKHVYYIASEDLFSNGFLSKLITWLVAPIPFKKSTSDIGAIKTCIRIAKEGGSIGMAPEGNRTYSGTTEYIKPGVASLVKSLKLPLILFRIEGGYGVQPRWSDKTRKGKMRVFPSRVLEYEEYSKMSNEELFEIINTELFVDERLDKSEFYSKHNAEYLDRAMYYCPYCKLTEFTSEKDIITCKSCGRSIRYMPDKTLQGIGFDFPFEYVKEWYDEQADYIVNLSLEPYKDKYLFADTVNFIDNKYCSKKIVVDKEATLMAYSDRFVVATDKEDFVFMYSDINSATVLGRNKMNIYVKQNIYQFRGSKHFNALKYLQLYYKTINDEKGELCGKYLGL